MAAVIRIALAGASGKMGLEVVRTLADADGMELVAAISRRGTGEDVGVLAGLPQPLGIPLEADLAAALARTRPDVLVDFTVPGQVEAHIETAINAGVHAVVGTTGLPRESIPGIDAAARDAGVGVLIVPNFALGAILMMRFAREAARLLPHVEIIELHHDQKKDAPSGTALLTAEVIENARRDAAARELERNGSHQLLQSAEPGGPSASGAPAASGEPARGMDKGGIHIHSVRLPGLVAHQEVIFGSPGELLTIRHDSLNRTSFMPGLLLAIQKVVDLRGAVYGLEPLLF